MPEEIAQLDGGLVYNGSQFVGLGGVANVLLAHNMDPNIMRPYVGKGGHTYITQNVGGKPRGVLVRNATASLRKEDWVQLDDAIVKAAVPRLQAVGIVRGAGLEYTIANGLGKTVLQTERMGDITDAEISMDGLRESKADRPQFDLTNLPLPIVHKDFHFSARQLAASRNGGSPLDTTTAELAGRKVGEMVEKLLLGTQTGTTYGGGTIYGFLNFPSALTKTITSPTASGWTPQTTLNEVLQMRDQAKAAYHYGPFRCFCSPNWDSYMDRDYSTSYPNNTLRQRIGLIPDVGVPKTLDYLTGYALLLVQMTSDVVRMVIGMDITTVQWETKGGFKLNFKVMCILVPQLRADINGNTGIVYGSV